MLAKKAVKIEKIEKPPLFDGRISEILEILKRTYELKEGFVAFSYDWYGISLKPNETINLGKIFGEGILKGFIVKVRMPDSTPPDIGPYYEFDDFTGRKYRFEEWTIYELYLLGLNAVTTTPIGCATIYDTTNYTYCGFYTREVHWANEFSFSIKNWSSQTATCDIMGIEAYLRPYARYVATK